MPKFISDAEMAQLEAKPIKKAAKPKKKVISDEEMAAMESGGPLETAADVLTTMPQGVTSWADEIQAGASAILQQGGGSRKGFSELYEPSVQSIRKGVAEARERSPIATTVGEIGTGIGTAFIPGLGAGKLSSGAAMIARGAVEGLGTAEDKLSSEGLIQTGIGAGFGAGGALLSGGLKKLHSINPKAERAAVLGAKSGEFKEIGIKEREAIADELKNMGLFSNQKVTFNTEKMKFEPQGKTLETLERPVRDKLAQRLQDASDVIQQKKMEVLGKAADKPINMDAVSEYLDKAAADFAKGKTGRSEVLTEALSLKDTIIQDMMLEMEDSLDEQPTLKLLEAAKNRLSKEVTAYGKNPLVAKTPHQAEMYQKFYSALNRVLREEVGDPRYAKFNETQQKMLTAMGDLAKAQASDAAAKSSIGWGNPFNRMANAVLSSEEASLSAAGMKEISDLPGLRQVGAAGRIVAPELPGAAIRYLDPSMPDVQVPFAPESQPTGKFNNVRPAFPFGATPEEQIRKLPGSTMLSPREIINFRIPRSTDGILQNKDKVVAKLAQNGIPDEMLRTVAQALDGDSSDLADIAPLLVTQFPTLFEKSKYKVFDGVILDPNDKARISDVISKRADVDSITKAKAINEINVSGKFPEGLV